MTKLKSFKQIYRTKKKQRTDKKNINVKNYAKTKTKTKKTKKR